MPLGTPEETARHLARTTLTGTVGLPVTDDVLQAPGAAERLGAWFRRENLLVSSLGYGFGKLGELSFDDDPSYNWHEDPLLKQYFPNGGYSDVLSRSKSAEHTQFLLGRILEEERRIEATQRSGFAEALFFGGLAAVVSPENLIPAGAIVKVGKLGSFSRGLVTGVASAGGTTAIAEVGLHATQDFRTWSESVGNITGATLLGGVLGGGASKLLGRKLAGAAEEFDNLKKLANEELDGRAPGAEIARIIEENPEYDQIVTFAQKSGEPDAWLQAVSVYRKVYDEVMGENAIKVNNQSWVRKVGRLAAGIPSIRQITNKRFAYAIGFGENATDNALFRLFPGTGHTAESMIENRVLHDAAILRRVKSIGKEATSNDKDYQVWSREVMDFVADPKASTEAWKGDPKRLQSLKAAADIMREDFVRFTRESEDVGVITGAFDGEGILEGTAEYWLTRVWDKKRLSLDVDFRNKAIADIANHLRENPDLIVDMGETGARAHEIAKDIIDTVVNEGVALTGKEQIRISAFDDRVVRIPDQVLKPYLIRDFESVYAYLERRSLPALVMAKKFQQHNPLLNILQREFAREIMGNEKRHTYGHLLSFSRYANSVKNAAELRRRGMSKSVRQDVVDKRNKTQLADNERPHVTRAEWIKDVQAYEAMAIKLWKLRKKIVDAGDDQSEALLESMLREEKLTAEFRRLEQELLGDKGNKNLVPAPDGGSYRRYMGDEEYILSRDDLEPDTNNPLFDPVGFYYEGDFNRALKVTQRQIKEARKTNADDGMLLKSYLEGADQEADDYYLMNKDDANAAARDHQRTKKSIVHTRDALLNRVGNDEAETWFAFAERSFRQMSFLSKMGGVPISSIPDTVMGIYVHGFGKWYGMVRTLATDIKAIKELGDEELSRLVAAIELSQTGHQMNFRYDMQDIEYRAKRGGPEMTGLDRIEGGLQRMTEVFQTMSGIKRWQWAMKGTSGLLASDNILTIATKKLKGKRLTSVEANAQKISGLTDQQLKAIAKMYNKHGSTVGGLKLGRSGTWKETRAGREIAELFEGTVLNDVRRTTITPGHGDRPVFMTKAYVRVFGLFRSFAMAATNKLLLSGLERRDAGVYQGMLALFTMGAVTNELKNMIAGREATSLESPAEVFEATLDAVDRSGMLGITADLGMLGFAAGQVAYGRRVSELMFDRFQDRDVTDIMFGPVIGAMEDIGRIQRALATRNEEDNEEGLSESQVKRMRRMIPFQNIWWLRTLIDGVKLGDLEYKGLQPEARIAEVL